MQWHANPWNIDMIFMDWMCYTSERQIPDLAKLILSADQINLYFIQLFVLIWQFCGTY